MHSRRVHIGAVTEDLRMAWHVHHDEASLAAAAIVRSVVTNPPPSAISRTDDQEGGGGRGRGRGRGTDNRPAWMTTGRTEHGSRSVTATDSGGSRDKFCVDLNRLSSQIYLEERRRLENEKRRLEKVERVRKEDEEMKRLEEESKRVEQLLANLRHARAKDTSNSV